MLWCKHTNTRPTMSPHRFGSRGRGENRGRWQVRKPRSDMRNGSILFGGQAKLRSEIQYEGPREEGGGSTWMSGLNWHDEDFSTSKLLGSSIRMFPAFIDCLLPTRCQVWLETPPTAWESFEGLTNGLLFSPFNNKHGNGPHTYKPPLAMTLQG